MRDRLYYKCTFKKTIDIIYDTTFLGLFYQTLRINAIVWNVLLKSLSLALTSCLFWKRQGLQMLKSEATSNLNDFLQQFLLNSIYSPLSL